ncbi:hypothetical protein HU200_041865 [Digitaria exilis]|uniref:Uncharacterized protein n=1 Tax=Digitaria exilis TaxID=1010633 RepID=A0A835EIX2_9POAL|nr:hypothetical protein HU200_041865 [Digitaria exilis]
MSSSHPLHYRQERAVDTTQRRISPRLPGHPAARLLCATQARRSEIGTRSDFLVPPVNHPYRANTFLFSCLLLRQPTARLMTPSPMAHPPFGVTSTQSTAASKPLLALSSPTTPAVFSVQITGTSLSEILLAEKARTPLPSGHGGGARELSAPPAPIAVVAASPESHDMGACRPERRIERKHRRPPSSLIEQRLRHLLGGAVLRGALNKMTLGFCANVQERCVLHAAWAAPTALSSSPTTAAAFSSDILADRELAREQVADAVPCAIVEAPAAAVLPDLPDQAAPPSAPRWRLTARLFPSPLSGA